MRPFDIPSRKTFSQEARISGTRRKSASMPSWHLRTVLAAQSVVPIGWIAVGSPPVILPPSEHDAIWAVQKPLDFPRYVVRRRAHAGRTADMAALTARRSAALGRHRGDTIRRHGLKRFRRAAPLPAFPAYAHASEKMVSRKPLGSLTSNARLFHSVSCGSDL